MDRVWRVIQMKIIGVVLRAASDSTAGTMSEKKLLTGHTVEPLDPEEVKAMQDAGIVYPFAMVRLQPDGWVLPESTAMKHLDKIYTFKFRPDDLVVMSWPKSGTTWLQEILWTMVHNPDLNHPEGNKPILDKSPDISFDFMLDSILAQFLKFDNIRRWFAEVCPGRKEEDGVMLQICELMSGRRIIKCHYPLCLMPPDFLDTVKVVYAARNPKDAVVSLHSMTSNLSHEENGIAFEKFARQIMKNNFIFCPYWRHMQLAWEQRNHPNMCFVFYEEHKADPMKLLKQLNDFIGTDLTQSQLDAVQHHTSFKSMKERGEPMTDPFFSNFFRKGKAGDWKDHFTPQLQEDMDAWIDENATKIGLTYKWD